MARQVLFLECNIHLPRVVQDKAINFPVSRLLWLGLGLWGLLGVPEGGSCLSELLLGTARRSRYLRTVGRLLRQPQIKLREDLLKPVRFALCFLEVSSHRRVKGLKVSSHLIDLFPERFDMLDDEALESGVLRDLLDLGLLFSIIAAAEMLSLIVDLVQ